MKYIVEKYFKKFNVAQTSYLECLLGRVCQWVFLMQKYKKEPRQNNCSGSLLGGPDRIRTDDPHNANVVRSQLRYKPMLYSETSLAQNSSKWEGKLKKREKTFAIAVLVLN